MKNCCNHTSTDTQCKRQSDGKVFDLPRKYSRKRCRNPKGFTMRSSCAPYKDCYKNKKKKKNKTRKQKTQKKQRGSGNKTRRRRDNTRKITRKTRKRKQTAGAETDERAETAAADPEQASSPKQPPSTAPEPRLSWKEMLPELAKRKINPLDCIAAQWLILKNKPSETLKKKLERTIDSIKKNLDNELGKDGIYTHIASDDFYTKWAVGGVGHASAVILSDLLDFLPGAGTVGMVHQFATDKFGAAVANFKKFQKARNMLRKKLTTEIDDMEILTGKLISVKNEWLKSLSPNQLEIYKNAKFLDDDMPSEI